MAHDDVGVGVVVRKAAVVVAISLGVIHEVDVRGTDPASQRAHQDLARSGHRVLRVSRTSIAPPRSTAARMWLSLPSVSPFQDSVSRKRPR